MSDPIAAAEAAGKARDIANRFETAVFLIAYGIAEKDGLYEADPHRYPYSQAFRHGMNILAALCAECSDDAEELLPTFNSTRLASSTQTSLATRAFSRHSLAHTFSEGSVRPELTYR